MAKGMLHLHLTVIIIFLLSFLFKTFLLFANNHLLLEKVRAKTKILEAILGSLILLTGIYLLVITKNSQTYMMIKIILVLAAIPLGIVGLRKENKMLTGLGLIIFFYVFGLSETRHFGLNIGRTVPPNHPSSLSEDTGTSSSSSHILTDNKTTSLENSKKIYEKMCIQCHGPKGNLGAGGAKDLSMSNLSDAQKTNIITNGKGLMAPFKYALSEHEISQMVEYVNTFKQK